MEASAQNRRPVRRVIGTLIFIIAVIGRSTLYAPGRDAAPVLTAAVAREVAAPVEQSADSVRPARRPLDDRRRRQADRARVADERRHRRCARHLAERAAHQRQGGRARSRCSSGTAAAPSAGTKSSCSAISRGCPNSSRSSSPRNRSTCAPTARPPCCRAPSRRRTSPTRWRASRAASSTAKRSSSRSSRWARPGRSNQVLLRVRFAEVSRSAMTELGVSLFTGADRVTRNYIGAVDHPAVRRARLRRSSTKGSTSAPRTSASSSPSATS